MNKRQQEQFIYFFDELCQAEEVLDKLKIDLQRKQGYNPNLIFDVLSQGNEEIMIAQFRRYLADRVPCSDRQLYQIYQKFDSKRNGFITRADFIRQLTPFNELQKSSPFDHFEGVFNAQIETSFLEIIIELLKRFRIIEQSRREIVSIQPWQAFEHLDRWRMGILGLGDFKQFYQDNDFQIGEESLYFLLHALRNRFDRNVNLEIFCEVLNPLEMGEYIGFAEEIKKQNEKQFLKRSRREEQDIKKIRVDKQNLEYEIQRAQRRKKVQIERQLNLQEKINIDLSQLDHQQQNLIRKAILQEQRELRSRSNLSNSLLQRDYMRNMEESRRVYEMQAMKEQQRLAKESLMRRIAEQQVALSASKTRVAMENQLTVQQSIEREKRSRRLLALEREEHLSRSRKFYEEDLIREKEVRLAELEKNRLMEHYQPETSYLARSAKQSRIQDLELELERTRAEMRERREWIQREEKLRLLETASKSIVSAFPY